MPMIAADEVLGELAGGTIVGPDAGHSQNEARSCNAAEQLSREIVS